MKKLVSIILAVLLLLIYPTAISAGDNSADEILVLETVERSPQTEYSYTALKELFPYAEFYPVNSLVFLNEEPTAIYEIELNKYDVLHLSIYSDGSYVYSGTATEEETCYYDSQKKEYLTRAIKNVYWQTGSSWHSYKMQYTVQYTHSLTTNTITINNMYPSGVNLNVSVNSLHYHVSGGSQYVMPIMFSTGSIATLHGHYGLFVNNPEDDSVVEGDSSFVLEWKIVANSNGTTTEYPETLLGPYPGFWYMD